MPTQTEMTPRAAWMLILAASAILMITMGARLTTGLFMSPINTSTGLGIASISFALAVGQFVWGAAQPVFGAVADKWGSAKVIILGALMLAAGMAPTAFARCSSILIGPPRQRLPAGPRPFAAGFINAGGSFGQFVFAPLMQAIISS